jgi:hypothetical protein
MTTTRREDPLPRLNELLIEALALVAKVGDADRACRLAADAQTLLRSSRPQEAARLNFALHRFVRQLPHLERTILEDLVMSEIATLDVHELPPAAVACFEGQRKCELESFQRRRSVGNVALDQSRRGSLLDLVQRHKPAERR